MADQGFKDAYREELKRLTQPEKALINMLSMLAEDNKPQAQAIVTALELHLHEVSFQTAASTAG
jgi:ferritin-like metal-binding protein YciE